MTETEKAAFLADIDKVLDSLREGIRMHSGDVELIDFKEDEGSVLIRLTGACVGCPFADVTLKHGIEDTLCHIFPNIQKVVNVGV